MILDNLKQIQPVMMKLFITLVFVFSPFLPAFGQTIEWDGREFEAVNVKATKVQLNGEEVLKVERDLDALPFDVDNLSETVDEPTYVRLKDMSLENGIFEVKVLSRLLAPSPFPPAQGFIGAAFRINQDDSAFESVYLRPNVGRSNNQLARNHTIQYFSYPNYKFDRLREESNGEFETYADIGMDEWITMRFEIQDKKATLFLNDQEYPAFIVNEMKGDLGSGSIALWVDIGTEGYFKDFKIIRNQ